MSKTYPNLDVTDGNEPQEISERDRKEYELIEYQINTMTLPDVAHAASSWLAFTFADYSDQQVNDMHKQLFGQEVH